jgi:hypothetical protein
MPLKSPQYPTGEACGWWYPPIIIIIIIIIVVVVVVVVFFVLVLVIPAGIRCLNTVMILVIIDVFWTGSQIYVTL